MSAEVRPPDGSGDRSYHWLQSKGGHQLIALWIDGGWVALEYPTYMSGDDLADQGFLYVCPVAAPETTPPDAPTPRPPLEAVGRTRCGWTIYRQVNSAGGYTYYTDEVAGVMYFDSCIHDPTIMREIMEIAALEPGAVRQTPTPTHADRFAPTGRYGQKDECDG